MLSRQYRSKRLFPERYFFASVAKIHVLTGSKYIAMEDERLQISKNVWRESIAGRAIERTHFEFADIHIDE